MWPIQRLQIYCESNQREQYLEWFNNCCTIDFYSFVELGHTQEEPKCKFVLIDFSSNRSWLSELKGIFDSHWVRQRKILIVLDPLDLGELILGNKLGVFDFILRPFGKIELLYRTYRMLHLDSALSHSPPVKTAPLSKLSLHLNTIKREAKRDSYPTVCLTPVEFSILQCLIQADGCLAQRSEIVNQIWGNVRISSKTLDVHVSNLRKKIQPLNLNVNWIETDSYVLEEMKKAVSKEVPTC